MNSKDHVFLVSNLIFIIFVALSQVSILYRTNQLTTSDVLISYQNITHFLGNMVNYDQHRFICMLYDCIWESSKQIVIF